MCTTVLHHVLTRRPPPISPRPPVYTDVENRRAWSECFSSSGIILPTGYYFGLTAATGDLTDTHEIYSVRVYDLDSPDQDPDVTKERANVLPSASIFEAPRGESGGEVEVGGA